VSISICVYGLKKEKRTANRTLQVSARKLAEPERGHVP